MSFSSSVVPQQEITRLEASCLSGARRHFDLSCHHNEQLSAGGRCAASCQRSGKRIQETFVASIESETSKAGAGGANCIGVMSNSMSSK